MKCTEIIDRMPDLAAGLEMASAAENQHLESCASCARQFEDFRRTMALLDEWQAPEPSPYFDVRLRARLREEQAKPTSWLYWLRKPALAASLAVLMVMSITLFRTDGGWHGGLDGSSAVAVMAEPGTAVGDLQALDKNSELYSDFEVLDDLQVQPDVSANP
jgi:hypothetical protein